MENSITCLSPLHLFPPLASHSVQISLAEWRRGLQIELFSPFLFSRVCIHLHCAVTSLLLCLFLKWKPFMVCHSLLHHLRSVVALVCSASYTKQKQAFYWCSSTFAEVIARQLLYTCSVFSCVFVGGSGLTHMWLGNMVQVSISENH